MSYVLLSFCEYLILTCFIETPISTVTVFTKYCTASWIQNSCKAKNCAKVVIAVLKRKFMSLSNSIASLKC